MEDFSVCKEDDEDLTARADEFLNYIRSLDYSNHDEILILSHCEFICNITGIGLYNAQATSMQLHS